MKKVLALIFLILFSGCAAITTGPQHKYTYPDAPVSFTPNYMSPAEAAARDICVNPEDQMTILENEIAWEAVYKKMKAIIDAINGEEE